MRTVTITRRKSLLGAFRPYILFVGYPKTAVDPQDPDDLWDFPGESDLRVSNGQTVTFPIRDGKCSIVVWAQTFTGAACGPAYYIDAGTDDIELELLTKYNLLDGSRYVLSPVSA